ncbi:MAG: hypothetical protein AB8H79_18895 [Myxococcota bacterium]
MRDLSRLIATLERLPGAASPHVVDRQHSQVLPDGQRLLLASGAWIEVASRPDWPSLDQVRAQVMGRWAPLFSGDSWDEYALQTPEIRAIEVRAMAGWSILWAVVQRDAEVVQAVCVQDDQARWDAEDAGALGHEFVDFAERNATWWALGPGRPGGWHVVVHDAG